MRLHYYSNVTSIYTQDLTVNFSYFTKRILPVLCLRVVHLTLCQTLFTLWNNGSIYCHYYICSITENYSLEIEKSVSLFEVTA